MTPPIDPHELILAAYDRAQEAVSVVDEHGVVIFANEGAARMLHRPLDQMLGRSVVELEPGMTLERHRDTWAHLREHGVRVARRQTPVMPDGHSYTIESRVTLVAMNGQRFAVTIMRDVSVQAAAEALVVRERQQALETARLHSLERAVNDIELLLRPNGDIVSANDRAVQTYGHSHEELCRLNLADLRTGDSAPALASQLASVIARGNAVWQTVNVRADGTHFDIEVSARVLEVDGTKYVHALGRDITARVHAEAALRESEARFRVVADAAPVLIWMADGESGTTWVNRSLLEFTGRKLEEELGFGWFERIHPDDLLRITQAIGDAIARQAPVSFEHRHLRHDGEWRWLLDTGTPRYDERGALLGYIGSCTDVTEQKKLEAELKRLNEGLEARVTEEVEKNREKDQVLIAQSRHAAMGEMLGNIAHQWRQPLNTLGLVLTNLEDDAREGPVSRERIEFVVADARRLLHKMSTTITDFRDFLVPDRAATRFSTRKIVADTISLVSASFAHRQIALELQAGDDDPQLLGFPNEYSQIVLNLLSNAKDAIGTRSGHVWLSLATEDGAGVLRVRDDGGGIARDVLPRMFDPYYSTKQTGTGIGLYMSKMIVERSLGGRIEARNVPGGAELTVSVPLPRAST